jgi:2-oxoglutarate ferredoxin oxidoreductase subunit alpha
MTIDSQGIGTKTRVEQLERVTIRFAGDSGDGMQLTGNQFTTTTALEGCDLATFPDYPAEIRAPAGTTAGVSGFQINFSSEEVFTPGDAPDVLVAMNPAALIVNLSDLKQNGILIVNTDAFRPNELKKAGYESNPLEDGSLTGYRTFKVELTTLTRTALKETGMVTRSVDRCKNFFALGMMYYLYNRTMEASLKWIKTKFASKPDLIEANELALKAGYMYCEVNEFFQVQYEVPAAKLTPGTYRNINGNEATALGLVVAAKKSGLQLFQGTYPITPASDILHELSHYKRFGVVTFQAEDEIAGIGSAIGAAYAGNLACTTTSGPGMALKGEFMGLAVMVELPLVIINVQRGGPSTGLPTKTEQSDLMQAMYGRHGESPMIVVAANSPADCFDTVFDAARLSLQHMTPVIVLTDGYIANGAEPWRLPEIDSIPEIEVQFATEPGPDGFMPYTRNEMLARPWAIPGTPGMEHHVGGLEKDHLTGNVSYVPENHAEMIELRREKVLRVADDIPDAKVDGDESGLLVLGWGSTFGAIQAAVKQARKQGLRVGHLHLRYLNPMQKNVADIIAQYDRILVPEMNLGQLARIIHERYQVEIIKLDKVQGKPFKESEILEKIVELAREN